MEIVRYAIGDVVRLKKPHPCGCDTWEVYRTGVDFGLRCRGCGHRVMIPRPKFEKAVRQRWPLGEGAPDPPPPKPAQGKGQKRR
ncbi:MAG: DUF951 domain-containing protein [Firmicutes bacterium]|nr:DUF951 domain-containing protein [Bacillota bacterium]